MEEVTAKEADIAVAAKKAAGTAVAKKAETVTGAKAVAERKAIRRKAVVEAKATRAKEAAAARPHEGRGGSLINHDEVRSRSRLYEDLVAAALVQFFPVNVLGYQWLLRNPTRSWIVWSLIVAADANGGNHGQLLGVELILLRNTVLAHPYLAYLTTLPAASRQ